MREALRMWRVGAAAFVFAAISLGLGGCDEDVRVTPTPAVETSPAPSPTPTPTPAPAPTPTIDDAYARLADEYPAVAEFVDAALAADVDTLLDLLQWHEMTCLDDEPRGTGPRCSSLGLPLGSTIMVAYEGHYYTFPRVRDWVATQFEHLLAGADPRIEVVAQRDDGQLLVSFATDTVTSLVDGGPVNGIAFRLDPAAAAIVVRYRVLVPTTSILEDLRDEEFFRTSEDERHEWEIWAASDELLERDAEVHRQRYDSPEARATPDLRR